MAWEDSREVTTNTIEKKNGMLRRRTDGFEGYIIPLPPKGPGTHTPVVRFRSNLIAHLTHLALYSISNV